MQGLTHTFQGSAGYLKQYFCIDAVASGIDNNWLIFVIIHVYLSMHMHAVGLQGSHIELLPVTTMLAVQDMVAPHHVMVSVLICIT